MNSKQSKNNRPIILSSALYIALVLGLALFSGSAYAQNEVKSTDLSQALKVFLDNMSAADPGAGRVFQSH